MGGLQTECDVEPTFEVALALCLVRLDENQLTLPSAASLSRRARRPMSR